MVLSILNKICLKPEKYKIIKRKSVIEDDIKYARITNILSKIVWDSKSETFYISRD